MTTLVEGVRHLYVHLPFCAHRCGYCDFVTLVGRPEQHARYVDALLGELELERGVLSEPLETVFLGGGTPTFTEPEALQRLLGRCPCGRGDDRGEPRDGHRGAREGFSRRAGSLESRWACRASRRGSWRCWSAGLDRTTSAGRSTIFVMPRLTTSPWISSTGSPARSPPTSNATWTRLSLSSPITSPVTSSSRSLEPGSRTDTETSSPARAKRWRATSSGSSSVWSRPDIGGTRRPTSAGLDASPGTTSGYWLGRDYLGLGIGAVSTVAGLRWRNAPSLGGYLSALEDAGAPARELEPIDDDTHRRERLMLGLRLDEPVPFADVAGA